jgi:hypothetical protein
MLVQAEVMTLLDPCRYGLALYRRRNAMGFTTLAFLLSGRDHHDS